MHRLFIAHHISVLLKGRQYKLQLVISALTFVLSLCFANGLLRFAGGKALRLGDFPGAVILVYAFLNIIYFIMTQNKTEVSKPELENERLVWTEEAIGESIID